jgi:hypothetical protein
MRMTEFRKPSFFSFRNLPFWASFMFVIIVAIGVWPG